MYIFADGIQAACTGILKGSGKQTVAYLATLVSYFGVGLPLSIIFAFRFNWDILGLCLGLMAGCYCYLLTTAALVACIDWNTEVKRARDRRLGQQRDSSIRMSGSGSTQLSLPWQRQASEGKSMADEHEDSLPAQRQEDKQEEKQHMEETKDVEAPMHSRDFAKQGKESEEVEAAAPPQGRDSSEECKRSRGAVDRANLAVVTIRLEEEEE